MESSETLHPSRPPEEAGRVATTSADSALSLRGRCHGYVLAVVVGALGVLLVHHPMLLSGLRRMQVNLGDTRFNNYILEHDYLWFRGEADHADFWNCPFFYPAPNVAAYSDILLSVAPVYGVFRLLGAPPDTAFQLWMIACSALNYVAGFHLLHRRFRLGIAAASVGAFVFAFGAPRINQLGHQQLLPQFMTLVTIDALLGLFDGVARSPGRRAWLWIAAMLGVVTQLYAGFYLGYFFLLGLGIATALAFSWQPSRRALLTTIRRDVWLILVSGIVGGLLLRPMLAHYLIAAREIGKRDLIIVNFFVPRATALLYLGPDSWVWGGPSWLQVIPAPVQEHEKRLGVGLLTLLAGALGIFCNRDRVSVRLIAGTSLVLLVCVIPVDQGLVIDSCILAVLVILTLAFRRCRVRRGESLIVLLLLVAFLHWNAFASSPMRGAALFALLLIITDLYQSRSEPLRFVVLGGAAACLALALFTPDVLALGLGFGIALGYVAWLLGVRPLARVVLSGARIWLLFAGLTSYNQEPTVLKVGLLAPIFLSATATNATERTNRPARRSSPAADRSIVAAMCVALFVTLVYEGNELAWVFLHLHLPGASALRAIGRVGVMMLILWGFGLALFIETLVARRRWVLALAVGLLCCLEQGLTTPSYDKDKNRTAIAELSRRINRTDVAFLYSPRHPTMPPWKYQLDAMWAGLEGGTPTINGYSGNCPKDWTPFMNTAIQDDCEALCVEVALRRWIETKRLPPGRIGWIGGREEWQPSHDSATLTRAGVGNGSNR